MLDLKTGILDKLKNIPTLNEITGGVGEQMTKFMAKIELPDTIMLNGLLSLRKAVNKLSAGRPSILGEERRKEISDYIMQYQHVGKEARREHKENVKAITAEKEEVKRQNLCPYCKTALVLRKGKYGDFYGCSNYPKCKYTGKV